MKNNYLYLQGSILQLQETLEKFAMGNATTKELQLDLDSMQQLLECQSHEEILNYLEI